MWWIEISYYLIAALLGELVVHSASIWRRHKPDMLGAERNSRFKLLTFTLISRASERANRMDIEKPCTSQCYHLLAPTISRITPTPQLEAESLDNQWSEARLPIICFNRPGLLSSHNSSRSASKIAIRIDNQIVSNQQTKWNEHQLDTWSKKAHTCSMKSHNLSLRLGKTRKRE